MAIVPRKNPLLVGEQVVKSFSLPAALMREVERQAELDGFAKLSPYVALLLCGALEVRERERAEEKNAST